jgi:N-dimethylarginine dimethylaminohydrolase
LETLERKAIVSNAPVILMSPPDFFEVAYAINPWMTAGDTVDLDLAKHQWGNLKAAIEAAGAEVKLAPPAQGLPDMVFTANSGVVHGKDVVLCHYKHPERQPEEPHMQAWFEQNGFTVHKLPEGVTFEGMGDALIWNDIIFSGYRQRTDIAAHNWITKYLKLPVLSIELPDPKFYHVDVCMCPTDLGDFIYYPGAFDAYGLQVIEAHIPAEKRLVVQASEANLFACNAVSVGSTLILNKGANTLKAELEGRGYTVVEVDMSEFLKAGGSCKCLTLRIA